MSVTKKKERRSRLSLYRNNRTMKGGSNAKKTGPSDELNNNIDSNFNNADMIEAYFLTREGKKDALKAQESLPNKLGVNNVYIQESKQNQYKRHSILSKKKPRFYASRKIKALYKREKSRKAHENMLIQLRYKDVKAIIKEIEKLTGKKYDRIIWSNLSLKEIEEVRQWLIDEELPKARKIHEANKIVSEIERLVGERYYLHYYLNMGSSLEGIEKQLKHLIDEELPKAKKEKEENDLKEILKEEYYKNRDKLNNLNKIYKNEWNYFVAASQMYPVSKPEKSAEHKALEKEVKELYSKLF